MFTERTEANEGIFRDYCFHLECYAPATYRIMVTWERSGAWNVVGFACDIDVSSEVSRWRDHYRASDLEVRGVWAERESR